MPEALLYFLLRFRKLCLDGFMALRRNANLFLILFLGMTAVGMPELTSADNLEFLRVSVFRMFVLVAVVVGANFNACFEVAWNAHTHY